MEPLKFLLLLLNYLPYLAQFSFRSRTISTMYGIIFINQNLRHYAGNVDILHVYFVLLFLLFNA